MHNYLKLLELVYAHVVHTQGVGEEGRGGGGGGGGREKMVISLCQDSENIFFWGGGCCFFGVKMFYCSLQ